jgi:hypothetical protein
MAEAPRRTNVLLAFRNKKTRLPRGQDVFRPVIPIKLRYERPSINMIALIDSGTDERYPQQWWSVYSVGGQYAEPAVDLHALQQVADLDVDLAVVAILDLAPFEEVRIRFIEQKNRAAACLVV